MMCNISVVIPVKNGECSLERCLQSIINQKRVSINKIYIIDSESSDKTYLIASKFKVEFIQISQSQFNHGLSRNIPLNNIKDDFVLYTVQDAYLSSDFVLEKMVKHFIDPSVMAVSGHQAVPKTDEMPPFYWHNRQSKPIVRKKQKIENDTCISNHIKRKVYSWDNVFSIYRKSALLELNFVETKYCEDWIWSYGAINKGWILVYDPSLTIFHCHKIIYDYCFKSRLTINFHLYTSIKIKPELTNIIKKLSQIVYFYLIKNKMKYQNSFYWMFKTFEKEIAEFLADFIALLIIKVNSTYFRKLYSFFVKEIPQGNIVNK